MHPRAKILLIVTIFLVLNSLSSAQPFIQQNVLDSGLTLETTLPSYHTIGRDFYIHTHVYNKSGFLVNTGLSCYTHVYSHQLGGVHILIANLTAYGAGYYTWLNGTLLTTTGQYSVLLWCNNTNEGGFIEYNFQVNSDGLPPTNDKSGWLAIIFSLAAMAGILLWVSNSLEAKRFALLKAYLFGLSTLFALLLGLYPLIISLNKGEVYAFKPLAIGLFSVQVILLIGWIFIYGLDLIKNTSQYIMEWQKKRGGRR